MLAHKADGTVVSGSYRALTDAFARGAEVKVGISGLCADLAENPSKTLDHEVFVQAGWTYNMTKTELFSAELHPLVRVAPAIPLRYGSKNWDFGWLWVRTDGFAIRWMVDPYTLKFSKIDANYGLRWFVR